MRVNEFEYRVRVLDEEEGIIVIDLVGGIFASNLEDFANVIRLQLDRLVKDVILNFGELDFISSSGIGQLVENNENYKKANKRLWVVELSPEIDRVFDQFSLDKILRMLPNERDALIEISASGL